MPAFAFRRTNETTTIAHRSFVEFDLEPSSASLLLLGPTQPPDDAERRYLADFVARGGRVVLADDFGSGNKFAEALGAATRFDGGSMMSLAYAKKPDFVVSAALAPAPVLDGVEEVVLSRATALHPGPGAVILGRTDSSSWIDLNGNFFRDGPDLIGPFVWIASERVGNGEILFLSDPSALINGMLDLGDNRQLAKNVARWVTEGGRAVLLDESHRDYFDPVRLLGSEVRSIPSAWKPVLAFVSVAAVFALVAGGTGRALRRAYARVRTSLRRLDRSERAEVDLVERVAARHPAWDENTLRSVHARLAERPPDD